MLFKIPGRKKQSGDEELLKAFRSEGDLEVLGELYSRYMHLVYGVCLKYLKDHEESMDAVMQIFEKLLVEIPDHEINNFRSWLHVVTKNFCLMKLRSQKSNNEKFIEWQKEEFAFMENGIDLHPIDKDEKKIDEALEDCISRLKEEQKECIKQFYFDNRCYNEIAVKMSIDEKKVKSYLQNAKRNLKLCLEEKNVREK
ncbi:MAG: sigma-70 family RNA polymerase sigma factor [Bacteroidales bacterium]